MERASWLDGIFEEEMPEDWIGKGRMGDIDHFYLETPMESSATPDASGRLVIGIFPTREGAESAWGAVMERGYSKDEVNLLMSDATHQRDSTGSVAEKETDTMAAQGAGVGGAIGGAVDAILAAIAAGASIALPGLGLIAIGPLAAAIAGASAGAAGGGLMGGLFGWGIPEEQVKDYEEGLRKGGIVVSVRARNAAEALEIEKNWRSHGGQIPASD